MSQARTTEILETSIGTYGGEYITTTDATTPTLARFVAIQAITDATVDAIVGNIDVSGITITAGTVIYGRWTSITLTSGEVIAYEGV